MTAFTNELYFPPEIFRSVTRVSFSKEGMNEDDFAIDVDLDRSPFAAAL